MSDRTELGLLLQGLRARRGESLTLMATNLGMTRSYLSAIELGKRRPPVGFGDRVTSAYELTREEREGLYRASIRNEEDDTHRKVLTSVIISALADYDDEFLLGLGMDIVREEGETGPIPTEVAIGLADSCDDEGSRLVRLRKDEVNLIARLLEEEINELREDVAMGAPDDIDFEMWLEIHDYRMLELRWCTALYEKVTGSLFNHSEESEYDDDE